MTKTVLFHRCCAIAWIIAGASSFVLGWQESVTFVVIASVYANVKSDWGAAEAADDRTILEELDKIRKLLEESNGRG